MRRRLFSTCCALSTAILVAVVAVWVRSYYAVDSLTLIDRFGDPDAPGHGYRSLGLSWSLGTVSLGGTKVLDRLPADDRRVMWGSFPASQLARRERPWLRFSSSSSSGPRQPRGWSRGTVLRWWRVTVPCWAVALVMAVLPAWWVARRRAARRSARRSEQGRCARCGYDLHGTTERCPECGTWAKLPAAV